MSWGDILTLQLDRRREVAQDLDTLGEAAAAGYDEPAHRRTERRSGVSRRGSRAPVGHGDASGGGRIASGQGRCPLRRPWSTAGFRTLSGTRQCASDTRLPCPSWRARARAGPRPAACPRGGAEPRRRTVAGLSRLVLWRDRFKEHAQPILRRAGGHGKMRFRRGGGAHVLRHEPFDFRASVLML